MAPVRWLIATVPLLLVGCVSELLGPSDVTTRTVTCAVLDPERDVDITWYTTDGEFPPSVQVATQRWFDAMANITGRLPDAFETHVDEAPPPPWDVLSLDRWAHTRPVLSDRVGLHVLWVPDIGEPGRSVLPVAPGVIMINSTVGDDVETLTGLLFHGMGHAMGVVNRGMPLHGPDLTDREAPAGHEPDPDSVMSARWHRIHDLPRNATTDRYSDALLEDWRYAVGPQGVCA